MTAKATTVLVILTLALAGWEVWLAHRFRLVVAQAAGTQQAVIAEVTRLREATVADNDGSRREVERLRQEVNQAAEQVAEGAERAQREVQRHAETLARAVADQRRRFSDRLQAELIGMRTAAAEAKAVLRELDAEILAAKANDALTRSALPKGENYAREALFESSYLRERLAILSRALAPLRTAPRQPIEFDLARSARPQVVGEIGLRLRRTNPLRHTYTIELVSGRLRIEHKDKGINEPVTFYAADARKRYQLVVREVAKDRVRGQLVVVN